MFILFLVSLLILPIGTHAVTIEQQKKIPPSDSFNYRLIDLGETDVPIEKLSTYALPNSLAPSLNNQRQVVCNQQAKGYIKDFRFGEISPQISSITSLCYGINNNGDLLLSFQRSPTDIEWWIWTQKNLRKEKAASIDLGDVRGNNVYLRKINNSKMAVGNFRPSGEFRPMVWSPQDGLHHLGYYLGWDVKGTAWDINDYGTVAGFLSDGEQNPPFAWNQKWGLETLTFFQKKWERITKKKVEGPIHFADLVVGENNLVYGTFWIEEPEGTVRKYLAYWWDPRGNEIRRIPIEGMRINNISPDNTLIGSFQGKAALCDPGNTPVFLQDLVENFPASWELLEASDTNSKGDIVGFGKLDGKVHYFLLVRE